MAQRERPLSPFMQYRWQYTNTLSILHRITGVFLSAAFFLLIYWLWSAAAGPEHYDHAVQVLGSVPAQLVLFVACASFFYHLLNGIRHLVFDFGYGFELKQARASGRATWIAALVLTALVWVLLVSRLGGTA
jgi:succinate dehydrogenase / fumarate reductase cytochrome b subunit